ncbi:MAG: c-type cytochrome [Betaproteobacteria bacterium]|nr:c-type cytochrome [Betaproteobacteria bacterium]
MEFNSMKLKKPNLGLASPVWALVFAALMSQVGGNVALAGQPGNVAAPRIAETLCINCHGAQGRNDSLLYPQLAGQPASYLEAQLVAFKDRTRADPQAQVYMWGFAGGLSDSAIKELAAYYAAQTPAAGTPQTADPREIAAGKKIFIEGIPSENVPACFACHGEEAQGKATFPRLAGQHRDYLVDQLQHFKDGRRSNAIMHNIVRNMTDEEFVSVSAYLESLGK